MAIKKVGIVVDNHKINKFKKELKAAGFTRFTIKPLSITGGISAFFIKTDESNLQKIHAVCVKCEIDINQSN